MTVSLVLLAAALLLAGGITPRKTQSSARGAQSSARGARDSVPSAGVSDRPAVERAPMSARKLRWVSGAAATLGCLSLLGIERGALCAAIGAPLAATFVVRLHARPQRLRATPSLALGLDLVSAALIAGQPLAHALLLAAPVVDGSCGAELARVGGLLQLGADPSDAWRIAADDPVLAPVAAAARRSATSGIRLAATFGLLAVEIRAQLRAAATSRAERAGVFAAAPLGLCFLPSFVCLGIVPTVVSVAGAALSGFS